MKPINFFFKYSLFLVAILLFTACGSDDPAPDESISIALTGTDLESTGSGQYRYEMESGEEVSIAVNVQSAVDLRNLVITKTINNQPDASWGTNGSMTVSASGKTLNHTFTYTPDVDDVDELVGFTFRATNTASKTADAILQLVVTLSPIDNLPMRRWNLTSVFWVNEDEEAIAECQKDDYMLLNADGTMSIEYGQNTGAGDCLFDGFNVYTGWEIVEEDGEMTFIRESYGIFDPETTKTETFTVKTLTATTLELEQTVDLTDLGGDPDQTFIYKYEAAPR